MPNVKLCSDIRVGNSSIWKQKEDRFKCKKDRLLYFPLNV